MRTAGEPDRVYVVASERYPDGTTLELPPEMAATQMGSAAVGCAVVDAQLKVLTLDLARARHPAAPAVFFVEARESTARPPVVSLIAFVGHGQPAGRLLDVVDAEGLGISGSDQVAAVRWRPSTGQALELYVQPAWRRRTVGTMLLGAAELLAVARDWPRLWGDGTRTAMGEQMRNSGTWTVRGADLTTLAPPMTPGTGTASGAAQGVGE